MLHNKFEMPLDLTFKTSKILYRYILTLFILAFVSIMISSALSPEIRFIFILILIVFTLYFFRNFTTHKIAGLRLTPEEKWEVLLTNQKIVAAELYGECIVTNYLLWLNFKTAEGDKVHLMILKDSADKEQLHFLRVRLRFMKEF